jgi:hypothetical protein
MKSNIQSVNKESWNWGYQALTLKNASFCDVAPCSRIEFDLHFGGMYCIYHQGRKLNQMSTSKLCLPPTFCWFTLSLFFDPEEGCSTFLQNVDDSWLHDVTFQTSQKRLLSRIKLVYIDYTRPNVKPVQENKHRLSLSRSLSSSYLYCDLGLWFTST